MYTDEYVTGYWNKVFFLSFGSALSPLMFAIVTDVVANDIKDGTLLEILHSDDLFLIAETKAGLHEKIIR